MLRPSLSPVDSPYRDCPICKAGSVTLDVLGRSVGFGVDGALDGLRDNEGESELATDGVSELDTDGSADGMEDGDTVGTREGRRDGLIG